MSREEIATSSQSRMAKRVRLQSAEPGRRSGTAGSAERIKANLSILESLPVELVEKIFLYSLNVNLPRASVVLNAAVSSERIYRALILLAFWDDAGGRADMERTGRWDGDSESSDISKILRPLDYTPLSEEERTALQSTVLRCRWCTLPRVLDQLPDLMNLTVQRYWVNAGITMEERQRNALARFLAREEDIDMFDGIDAQNTRYSLSIVPHVSVAVTNRETGLRRVHRVLSVRDFPEKLLSGNGGAGFGDDDATFLEILRIACAFNRSDTLETSHAITLSRDALQQGIHTALVQRDTRALTILLKLDEYFVRAQNISLPGRQPHYAIPPEHFRTAIRASPSNPAPLQLLLRASAESVPPDDAELTQWAMDVGPPLGDWLLDLMMRVPQLVEEARENPVLGSVFYLGRANGMTEMGARYLGEVLEADGLGSWMEECDVGVAELLA